MTKIAIAHNNCSCPSRLFFIGSHLVKKVKRRSSPGNEQDGGVRQPVPVGPLAWDKLGCHEEAVVQPMAPPPGKARGIHYNLLEVWFTGIRGSSVGFNVLCFLL